MPTNKKLHSKATKSIAHLSWGTVMGKVVALGTMLILTRMLNPADYGMMALAVIGIVFVGLFNEVGIGAAIAQKAEPPSTKIKGCFAIPILPHLLLGLATVFGSGLATEFFKTSLRQDMTSVLTADVILGIPRSKHIYEFESAQERACSCVGIESISFSVSGRS